MIGLLPVLSKFIKESGMRKVGSCMAVFAACAFLRLRNVLPAEDFVTITLVVLAGLVGGNAIEHALNRKKPEEPKVDAPPAA